MASIVSFGEHHPIVGRHREQGQLRQILDAALAGSGSLALISGEAGIGKTTLVRDLIHEATQQGCLVLTGGCYDLTTTPPYGPWSEAIRGYQPYGEQPSVPAWFGNSEELEKVGSQAALFEEARRFFASIAGQQPLVIVLEDLHWADAASLDALRYLSRTLDQAAILLIATYRDDEITRRHELYQLLPLLVRESQAQRIHLHQFDHDDVRELTAGRYDLRDADLDRLVTHVAERSEGNPFFAEEILQGLEDDRILQPAADGWLLGDLERVQVPQLVRQALDQRLSTLAAETLTALQVAAVIGQNVQIETWQGVQGLDDDAFERVMAEALESRTLEEAASPGILTFRHALIREALYESLILNRRRAWHRAVGEALSETPNPDPDTVARHFQESSDPRAPRWLVRAAVRAEESYAFRIAVEHYATAIALLETEPEAARTRGWLLSHVGHVMRSFDRERGLAYIADALAVARQVDDPVLAAYSRTHRGIMYCNREDYRQGLEEMERAIQIHEAVSPQQMETARQVLTSIFPPGIFTNPRRLSGGALAKVGTLPGINLGIHAYVMQLTSAGQFRKAIDLGEPYVAQVEAATTDELTILDHCRDIYFGLFHAYSALGEPERAERWWQEAHGAYRALNHRWLVSGTLMHRLRHLLIYAADNPSALWHALEAVTVATDAAGTASGIDVSTEVHALPLYMRGGRWDRIREMEQQRREPRLPFERRNWLEAVCMLALEGDDLAAGWAEMRHTLPNLQPEPPGDSPFSHMLSALQAATALSLAEGDLEKAWIWIDALDHWLDWSGAVIGHSEASLLRARYHRLAGDLHEAHRYAEVALDHAANPRQPLALLAAHRLLGELDTALQRFDEAAGHLQAALDLADRCAAPYERALTLLAMAECAAARDDAQAATGFLREARAICQELGARRSLRCADEIEAGLRRQLADHPAGLSDREVEVLELVAGGMTNAGAADALYISPRTVAQHLRSVYNKLGVNSRAAAVSRWADLQNT